VPSWLSINAIVVQIHRPFQIKTCGKVGNLKASLGIADYLQMSEIGIPSSLHPAKASVQEHDEQTEIVRSAEVGEIGILDFSEDLLA
jgi:hypothetical protein